MHSATIKILVCIFECSQNQKLYNLRDKIEEKLNLFRSRRRRQFWTPRRKLEDDNTEVYLWDT